MTPASFLELNGAACLPLALTTADDGAPAVLSVALQHPPLQARAGLSRHFSVTGPCADRATAVLQRAYDHFAFQKLLNVEIELAIPTEMGLGSDAVTAFVMLQLAARLNGLDASLETLAAALDRTMYHPFQLKAMQSGGLSLANADTFGAPLAHADLRGDEKNAWAFVLVMPRLASEEYGASEAQQMSRLIAEAAEGGAPHSAIVEEELLPAVAGDDLSAFGHVLTRLQADNTQLWASANLNAPVTPWEQSVFAVMCEHGAVATGRSLTGRALFALARGARSTIDMRTALRGVVGRDQGTMIATIAANIGAHIVEKRGPLHAPDQVFVDRL